MILVDANLLIYAWNNAAPEHDVARTWLEARLNGVEGVGLPWMSLLGFVRVVSNPRIFSDPSPVVDAWACVEDWLALPNVFVPEPTVRHTTVYRSLLSRVERSGLVPDAHLASLAIEYGLILQSADEDFRRFPGLRCENPLRG